MTGTSWRKDLSLPGKATVSNRRYNRLVGMRHTQYDSDEIESVIWHLEHPSRRLRKLYKQLEALDADIEYARQRKYHPEHAPSDYVTRRRIVNVLLGVRDRLWKRIDMLQNT